ncbi:MAG: hypothetical protein ACJATE_002083 [Bacteroidia bacterium]|jgi:hypothetical protein
MVGNTKGEWIFFTSNSLSALLIIGNPSGIAENLMLKATHFDIFDDLKKHRMSFFRFCLFFVLVFAFSPSIAQNIETEIRYYGTGCFTIQRGENVLLTDPFIDNPSVTRVLFGKVRTDTSYVMQYLNPAALSKVKLVIAAHAHYDHLMDMPYLSKFIPDSAQIVSSKTSKHLLSYYKLPQDIVVVNNNMGTENKVGQWHYSLDSTMRTMAFKSLHPPHIAGINFLKKRYSQDLVAEPTLVSDWQEGQTLSFMVDWLEDSVVSYRIFFMSSMAKAPFGLFPKELLSERGIDDLFIGSSGTSEYSSYPGPIVELSKPKRIFLIHWENFFRKKDQPFKAIDGKGLKSMEEDLAAKCAPGTQVITAVPLHYY